MKKIVLLQILTVSILSLQAQINKIEAVADIKEATIYTSSAEIFNEKEVLLKPGKNEVIFTELTSYIEPNTINVSVNHDDVDIVTVTEKINFLKEYISSSEQAVRLNDSIKRLEREMGLNACKIDALNAEMAVLFKNESIGGVSDGVSTDEVAKAAKFYRERYLQIKLELFELNEIQEKLTSKITMFNYQISQKTVKTSESISEIILIVNCKVQKKVKFSFKFLTRKSGWAPLYDFKYNGPAKPLEFVFRANVFNASGIDWNDIKIKLSTADPIRGFDLPSFSTSRSSNSYNASSVEYDGEVVNFRQVQAPDVITEYKIKHVYSIPSDAKPYLVDVETYTMSSTFNYLLIPKLDPFGFLMAKIPGWNKYNLIPGVTNVYNQGTYMGKTFLNTYAPNDTLSVYLGKDKNVQATRKEETNDHERLIIGNFEVDETKIDIEIRNNYTEKLNIEIMDQVPIMDGYDKVKFQLIGADDAEYSKNDGILKWRIGLSAGETKKINFKYTVKAPKEFSESIRIRSRARYKFKTISCPSF